MRSSTSRVLRDRLCFVLPFKGYRVLSKTSIMCGALVPCLWAWLSSCASSGEPCLSLGATAMRTRQHVSTPLLHIIGIHEGEPMSTTWLTRRCWPFAARDKTPTRVQWTAVRSACRRLPRLISRAQLTKNVGFCPKGPSSGCGARICGLGIGGATGLFSTPVAARWLSLRCEGPLTLAFFAAFGVEVDEFVRLGAGGGLELVAFRVTTMSKAAV